ncbi:glycosyltransferase [Pseudalkalibacillus sp. NRS-1564]|uniref:glycosyltransferase n=1 Tax=Pseudalkalibacillus sp. NRS-1564 TaxID=3233900 RepID=UPI003D265435
MADKRYSVLISVYTRENPDYFKLSIESMVNQTLGPEEIVIVKDGPLTEELDKIVDYYVSNYSELFTIVTLTKNVGLGKALNEGLRVCRNELVARMDTDDISLLYRYELQVNEFIKDKDLDIIGSNIDEFYENSNEIVSSRIVPIEHEEIMKFSKRRNPFNHPTVMYKKSSVLRNSGYSDFRRNQDLDLFVRMLNNGCNARNINQSLLLFRANNENLKRRKSWKKCKSYISMIYSFWRNGYSSLIDLTIVAASQIIIFVSPSWVLESITSKYLRKTYKSR